MGRESRSFADPRTSHGTVVHATGRVATLNERTNTESPNARGSCRPTDSERRNLGALRLLSAAAARSPCGGGDAVDPGGGGDVSSGGGSSGGDELNPLCSSCHAGGSTDAGALDG